MPTFRYDKLVRDKIAQWHVESGHTPTYRHLEGEEHIKALCKKLHEESDEVDGALTTEELAEELADVQQIIDDICAIKGITKTELEQTQQKKRDRKGGFLDGVYIEQVYMPNDADKWVTYCRKEPTKYPEIKDAGDA